MLMKTMQDIRTQSDQDLAETVTRARETLRVERFKDKFTRKASIIRNAKLEAARALSELTARRRNQATK